MNTTIIGFIKKELVQTLRNPRMRVILFGVPLIQLTIFGLALSNDVKNIRIAFFYQPHDSLMERIQERTIASKWFIPANTGKETDPFRLIQDGRADAVVIAPEKGLTTDFAKNQGRIQLLVDATNALRARSVEAYMQAIAHEVAANQARSLPQSVPLSFQVRVLYNPTMDTTVYMIPGVMCTMLCLITIILTSSSMVREKEMGTFETLISAPVSKWEILTGKTVPYILLGICDVPLILTVGIFLFGVPMNGSFWVLAFSSLIFVCTTVSIGTLISTFAQNQQQSMLGGFLFLFPAIQLSGVMTPLENIPKYFRFVIYLDPLQYFVALLRNIMLKGGEMEFVIINLAALGTLGLISIFITIKRFHQTLN